MDRSSPRSHVLRDLRTRLKHIERSRQAVPKRKETSVSTGIEAFDSLLLDGGLKLGTLIEWLAEGEGSGAGTLALTAAARVLPSGGACVVVDHTSDFHPPAAAALGIDLESTVVVRPGSRRDTLWALELSLQCPAVALTWCRLDRLDGRAFRRLQLAAEKGGGLGFLIRPAAVRGDPSWADLRLLVRPVPSVDSSSESNGRRLQVKLLRTRNGLDGGAVELDISDETGSVRPASPLAPSEDPQHATGA